MARREKDNISENMVSHLHKLRENIPQMLNKPFQFSQKEDHIPWNDLEDLDIDQVIANNDFKTLEKLLSHCTYSKIRKEDIDRIADPAMIKLFKLSQLSMEYMQFTQNTLENIIEGVDVKYKHSFQRCKAVENKVINQQMEINRLRNEIEVKKGAVKAYSMHMKDKAIRKKNRIALLKRNKLRCPD